ncbi:STE/STE20/YSK protein kinase [Coniosporium apollinis CBS 100218]|uniref:non-specific serine/threonine protein kinase n=1 Tax=Coniosporium apollinis (strain CBS 100218) TaxID=1168221 RepID=R7YM45_CONA1|nr:STE/STE20/YSK protein kinase [Coniosporium apollinis CBS 100218]EON62980.1 STE/STE20/YSK protein kinase [Coniosporium apollinis CBS 100218]
MADNYQVLEELGSGSFGVVYKAIEKSTGEMVAIKHIDLEGGDDDIREIQQEIALLSTCASPFVTQYKTSFVRGVKLWIVMEYLGGGSCLDLLKPGPFTEAQIAIIMRELLLGLDYLHQTGKIHRDIKAANVLLSNKGKVKIADFGVAAQLTNIKSQRMTFVGTPFWMAPEVIQEAGYDFKADIWSLGITAMEMANGEPPNASTHPMKVLFLIPKQPAPRLDANRFSKEFRDFVAQCLIKDPDRRATAEELLRHRFIQRAGKVEALRELIERRQQFDAREEREAYPKYYEETLQDITPTEEKEEWVFDTIKPATIAPTRHTSKRRKLTRIPSNDWDINPETLMERLDLNDTPLGTMSPAPNMSNIRKVRNTPDRRRSSGANTAIRTPSGATPTARRVPSSATPTARRVPSSQTPTSRRVSGQATKQPLGLDMSFGNGTSTTRLFRRVSAEKENSPIAAEPAPALSPSRKPSTTPSLLHDSTNHAPPAPSQPPNPSTPSAHPQDFTGTVTRITKEALLGRKAYAKAIEPALQETYAATATARKREALAAVAHAWSVLDRVDPEGELLLLKAVVERCKGEPKLAAALGLAAPPIKNPAVPVLSPSAEWATGEQESQTSTPTSSPTKQKLVLAQNNPHLKSHRRRQSAFVGPTGGFGGGEGKNDGGEEARMPGQGVVPGLEHVSTLADVLYRRWVEGLRGRWGGA